jgi:hypothetical protein
MAGHGLRGKQGLHPPIGNAEGRVAEREATTRAMSTADVSLMPQQASAPLRNLVHAQPRAIVSIALHDAGKEQHEKDDEPHGRTLTRAN